jgi:glycosyltransferase involved in cell wall biosynthesis
VPVARARNPAGCVVACEFSSVCGAAFAKTDWISSGEGVASNRFLVAGSWVGDSAVVLWIRGGYIGPQVRQVAWLEKELRRPSFLMPRGIDAQQFNPKRRTVNDRTLRLGVVGRITPEKGVRLLWDIEKALVANGVRDFRETPLAPWRICGRAARRRTRLGLCQHGFVRVSFAHRHVWKCDPGSIGFTGALDRDE